MLYYFSYLHVELESLDSLLYQPLLYVHVQVQLIHTTPIQLLEGLRAMDGIKMIEFHTFTSRRQLQGSLRHLPQHLAPRKVPHVAGVGVGHKQNWVLSPHLMNAVHVTLCGLRTRHLALPVRAIKVLKVTGQGLVAVQLCRKI